MVPSCGLCASLHRFDDMVGVAQNCAKWVPKRAEALQAPPSCLSKQHMRYCGVEYSSELRLQFGCITVDHHHLWGECKQNGVWPVHGSINMG